MSAISNFSVSLTIVEASTDTTTTSASDVLMSGMTTTPAVGSYLVWFEGDVTHNSSGSTINTSIYFNGAIIATSNRQWQRGNQTMGGSFACVAKITADGINAIEGRWSTSGATATCHRRQLYLIPVT